MNICTQLKSINKRWAALVVGLVCSVFAVQDAVSAPAMVIQYTHQIGELDGTTPVSNTVSTLERKNNYNVINVSMDDLPENYLIELVLPAGANQGVYYATEDSGNWDVQILADSTVFSGNGESIAPAGNLTFSLYVPDIQPIDSGLAEASSSTLDFNSVSVTIPVALPAQTVPLSIMGNSFGFDADPGETYHVFFTTSLTDDPWTTLMIISGNGASVTIPFDLRHDSGFYKVEEQ